MYTKKVNHRHSNGTKLECPTFGDYNSDYKLTIGNQTSTIFERDGRYLSAAIDIINTFGAISLDRIDYNLLKNDEHYKSLLKYVKLLYPVSLDAEFCVGRFYGANEGKLRKIELVLESRWPWSINKMLVRGSSVDINKLILKSEWVSDFRQTLQCQIVTPGGQILDVPSSFQWTLSTIEAVSIIIAGSYLKGFNWLGTFEGRIFNSGDDIDDLIRNGYVRVNGFG